MFGYVNCYDKIINGTLIPEKVCYTCDSFCEFSIFIFSLLFCTCCINTFCCTTKKKYKEIKVIDPHSPPPYS